MSLSLYDVTVPVFIHALNNLSKNLEKARAFATEQGIAHEEFLTSRLYPDMLPLSRQVQICSDTSRGVAVRIGQAEPRPMADTETTFDELQARITATIDYLKSVPAAGYEGREDIPILMKFGPREVNFTGKSYVLGFAIPNFFFHASTAYGIMRHKGVVLGKADFLGG